MNGNEIAAHYAVLGITADVSDRDVHRARRRAAWAAHPDRGGSHSAMAAVNAAYVAIMGARRVATVGEVVGSMPVHNDVPSFTIDVLPVEAFEYVALAAQELGEIVDSDPPYVLEVMLYSRNGAVSADHVMSDSGTWCRLDLVPDAGSSTVSLWCEGDAEWCRDLWVQSINALGGRRHTARDE